MVVRLPQQWPPPPLPCHWQSSHAAARLSFLERGPSRRAVPRHACLSLSVAYRPTSRHQALGRSTQASPVCTSLHVLYSTVQVQYSTVHTVQFYSTWKERGEPAQRLWNSVLLYRSIGGVGWLCMHASAPLVGRLYIHTPGRGPDAPPVLVGLGSSQQAEDDSLVTRPGARPCACACASSTLLRIPEGGGPVYSTVPAICSVESRV